MNIPHFSKIRINTIYNDNHILNNLRIITVKIFGYYIVVIPQDCHGKPRGIFTNKS